MSRFRGRRGRTLWPMLLCLLLGAGCSSPNGLRSGDGSAPASPPQVPFHEDGAGTNPHTGVASGAQESGSKPETGLPFRDPQSLPAGTLLTVRLKNPITTENPAIGTFEAVVDEPVVIEGSPVVPRGASVEGRVESARASKVKRNRGYVCLTLDSIGLAGKDLPLQTSSLFARGNANEAHSSSTTPAAVITLEKGRRLTFRLAQAVYVANQQASPGR